MAIRFGTDGIRGHAGQGAITAETAAAVGRSAARWALDAGTGRVVIGRDTRPSGPMLEDAVSAGVAAAGGEARIAGVLPTAAIAHALAEGLADTGVMITASHNPWPDNGFKVLLPGGRKPDDADAARLEEWIAEPSTLHATGSQLDISRTAAQAYRSALRSAAGDLSALGRRAIAVDLANGAASSMVNFLRDLVPGQTVILGADGGPTNEGVGSEHPEALCAAVVEHGCYAGIAVDGDADRCRLVDGRGEVVAGDALAWLLAYHGKVDALAVTVMSNQGLEASLPGVRLVRTPVGDRHLAAAMRADGLPLGAEESGHVLFADGLVAGDGLLTGLRALALAARHGPLHEVLVGYRPLPRQLAKVRVARRPPLHEVPALVAACAAGEARLGEHGRVFIRYSGTEPVLRVLVEGAEEAVGPVLDAVVAAAREALS